MKNSPSIPGYVMNKLRRAASCPEGDIRFECIRQGKWCNANLYQVELCGQQLVVKEFYSRHPLVRFTIGRFLISAVNRKQCHRQTRPLNRLSSPGA